MHFLSPTWYDQLASTNTTLCEKVRNDPRLPSGTIIAAREQTAGKGRHGNKWISSPRRDLCVSFLVKTRADAVKLSSLPMATAIGISDFIINNGMTPKLKWPNDVMVNKRKIAGILVDAIKQPGRTCAIVGIGININMSCAETRAIEQPATSILRETGLELSMEHALDLLLPELATWIGKWQKHGFAGISQAWSSRAYGVGAKVTVAQGKQTFVGMVIGFDSQGQMLLQTDREEDKAISYGRIIDWH